MDGIVLKSTGSFYKVQTNHGVLECKLGGRFRLEGLKHTNPVSVGDHVMISEEESGLIIDVKPRRNYLIRKATNLAKQTHIIAANIDQLIIVASYKLPRTSTGFIDRVLATAEAYNVKAVIIFNKIDLLDDDDLHKVVGYSEVYNNLGYETLMISTHNAEDIERVKILVKDKISLFTGHSGVGKSTLINKIDPLLNLRTDQISDKFNKGKHTTTFAEMIPLSAGGYIIDTPGIKEFGMVSMDKHEVTDYFRELFSVKSNCKFNNCLHVNEPGCAVIKALEEGKIAEFRYHNYLNILDSVE